MSARPWYREPMLALVIGLPATAVIAGIATLVLAIRSADDAGDLRVHRVAQVQTTDIAPDRAAAQLGLSAVATIDAGGVVRLAFAYTATGDTTLTLRLRHGTDPRRDRDVTLSRVEDSAWAGLLSGPLTAGAYNAELEPGDGAWRLVGRLEDGAVRVPLAAAVAVAD
jgi:uncharacterized protein